MEKLLSELQEMFINKEIGGRIKYLRKMRNLTIKQAAEKSITTEKCWSDWENGKSIPRKGNRKIIASALNVSEEMIFGNPKEYAFIRYEKNHVGNILI
jgi:transcriptional regulator with XRE-family HTH domain